MTKTYRQYWTVERSREYYNIPIWSEKYFDVNDIGHVIVKPTGLVSIDLAEVANKLREQGFSFPVLIRFPQILQARVQELCNAFTHAAQASNCTLAHIPFYPIKVNQQRTVIEKILSSSVEKIGLEVGSKTELLVALGSLDGADGMLICNGYKDRAYIRIALHAQQMGIDVYIVVENLSELNVIRDESLILGIIPKLGVRVRLNSVAAGNWQNSGGRDAKFGLGAHELLKYLNILKSWGCVEWLRMVHFHMGSQISNLEDFSRGLLEAMQIYSEIHSHEFAPENIDIGGGLAVDYSSQQNTSYFSKSYSMQDYACTIVETITNFCKQNQLAIPTVFTENGRAMTAHHAMLMTDILEVENQNYNREQYQNLYQDINNSDDRLQNLSRQIEQMISQRELISAKTIEEFQNHLSDQFLVGEVSLEQRAWAEGLIHEYQVMLAQSSDTNASDALVSADKYYGNFSIFQSMPDVWGLEQIFPIVPLARLDEEPTKEVRLHDLTCDSDGQISRYSADGCLKNSLRLHSLASGEKYLLGFFLLGAYQEVLGDIHNLFGDTHAVNVEQDQDGQLQFSELEIGDCANELLNSVHLEGEQIISRCQARLIGIGANSTATNKILDEIKNALFGYTYLDSIDRPAHRIKR